MRTGVTTVLESTERESTRHAFYPTPEDLAQKMLAGIDWYTINSVLEPSAGKGDLARVIASKMHNRRWGYPPYDDRTKKEAVLGANLDCIELDPLLRNALEGQGFRVIHDDFLGFETQKRYDLIVMNPPFDHGAEHLLHAMALLRHGGHVICLLNAETLRNPCTETRKALSDQLGLYGANVRYERGAFRQAERKTDVDVAIVDVTIPAEEWDDSITDRLRKAPDYKTSSVPEQYSEIVRYNDLDRWVNQYNFEVSCGLRLIDEYEKMRPHILDQMDGSKYSRPILDLSVINGLGGTQESKANGYIKHVRYKYWQAIFQSDMFMQGLTSNLQSELHDRVRELADYDFSAYNILTLLVKMTSKINQGVEDTIVSLFDSWTRKTWNQDSPNRHYYNGWSTNEAYKVGKKVIIDLYTFELRYDNRREFCVRRAVSLFQDIEKVFDYLDAGKTEWNGPTIQQMMDSADAAQNWRNLDTKYFTATLYKKNTAHLVFKDMDLLAKFNLFAGQKHAWLPPTYGKRRYKDMTSAEKQVIDSFQGKEAYEHVMDHADYFLPEAPAAPMLMLTAGK